MIELLTQLAHPPAIISQILNPQSDISRSCPGFSLEDNLQISRAAITYLIQQNPELRNAPNRPVVRIFFTWEMVSVVQSAAIIRFVNFIQQSSSEYRFVFFCPVLENVFVFDVILSQAARYISSQFGIPYVSYSDLINNQLGLTEIGRFNGGTLFYIRPRG